MDALAELPNLFVRSIPSRGARNGLCDNIVDLLCVLETYEFSEIILETVGVGQAETDVRGLVDTMVLVVPPDAGDSIQAMKAGIIECADIFVMTKAENGAAVKARSDIAGILKHRISGSDCWVPRLVMTERNGAGVETLDQVISSHREWVSAHHNKARIAKRRRQAHLQDLIIRRMNEVLGTELDIYKSNLQNAYAMLLNRMRQDDYRN
jgi:LAO/AO transport system kinase